jgi:hypothetical protein
MPFLTSAQHDVFISYAHDDNEPDRKGEDGWVKQFHDQLTVKLLKRFGESVDVWRDPNLGRSQEFNAVLEEAVRGSGVTLSFISNRYLKSKYCLKELDWFRDTCSRDAIGQTVSKYRRTIPILLYDILPEEWPDTCKGATGFHFHTGKDLKFVEPLAPDSAEFRLRLGELVEELYTILNLLKTSHSTVAPAPDKPTFRIFLANPTDDLRGCHRQLVEGLGRAGMTLLGNIPPPYDEPGHTETVRKALTDADLSIHLLGDSPGEAISEENPAATYSVVQARESLEYARSQLILIPDELDLKALQNAEYASFLNNLADHSPTGNQFELVRTGKRQILDAILAKHARIEEARHQSRPSNLTAFIDLHEKDLSKAMNLVAYLGQKGIFPVTIPSSDVSLSSSFSIFEENLKRSQLFIVVFGTVARQWVENRLFDALKLILTKRLSTRLGVYVAPPRKLPEDLSFPAQFEILNNMEQFDPRTLDTLFKSAGVAP